MSRAAPPPDRPPAGIYVHFPFCASRCTYCDFPTAAGREDLIAPYLQALRAEITTFQTRLPSAVDTVYLGGGTPSRMTPVQVFSVLRAVRRRFQIQEDAEITLEANPEDIDRESLAGWIETGVNRLSLGVQTLEDEVLRQVGRGHTGRRALESLDLALASGVPEVSADLIAGFPGEPLERWGETVRTVAKSGVGHVSVYLLETDKDAPLARAIRSGRTPMAEDEALVAAYRTTVDVLEEHGLRQYEISNFARPGHDSRHNRKYWEDAPYGGFGVGAHAYVRGERRANPRALERYLAALSGGKDPVAWRETWNPVRRLEEALMMGLRLVEGIDLSIPGERYGMDPLEVYATVWESAEQAGMVRRTGSRIALTPEGRLVSNELFREIIGFLDSGGEA